MRQVIYWKPLYRPRDVIHKLLWNRVAWYHGVKYCCCLYLCVTEMMQSVGFIREIFRVVNPFQSRYLRQRGAGIEDDKADRIMFHCAKCEKCKRKTNLRFQPLTFAWFLGTMLWLARGSIRSHREKYRMWSRRPLLKSLLICVPKVRSLMFARAQTYWFIMTASKMV